MLLVALLGLLGGNLGGQQGVGHRHRRRAADGGAEKQKDEGDGEQLGEELEGHPALAHPDGGQHPDFIFALPDVEDVEHDENGAPDEQHHQQEPGGELAQVL